MNGSENQAVLQIVNMVAGHYTFVLTVVDGEGLRDSDSASIVVKEGSVVTPVGTVQIRRGLLMSAHFCSYFILMFQLYSTRTSIAHWIWHSTSGFGLSLLRLEFHCGKDGGSF